MIVRWVCPLKEKLAAFLGCTPWWAELRLATAVRLPVHHQYSILPHEGKVRTCSQQVLQALLAIGTVTRGERRLFEKSQHFTGGILLRTGSNTQEGDYHLLNVGNYAKKTKIFV